MAQPSPRHILILLSHQTEQITRRQVLKKIARVAKSLEIAARKVKGWEIGRRARRRGEGEGEVERQGCGLADGVMQRGGRGHGVDSTEEGSHARCLEGGHRVPVTVVAEKGREGQRHRRMGGMKAYALARPLPMRKSVSTTLEHSSRTTVFRRGSRVGSEELIICSAFKVSGGSSDRGEASAP